MKKIIELMRKMKDWMEAFADRPSAMWWLFALSFMESSFFPIPPDVLLIAIAVSNPKKAFKAALFCTLGSVLGGVFGYYIGYALMDTVGNPIIETLGKQDSVEKFKLLYDEYGIMFLAGAAFTPIPYKVATIISGAINMDLLPFIVVSSLGRAGRFFLVGGMIWKFGPQIKDKIEQYFDKLSIAFLALLVGGFIAVKYLF